MRVILVICVVALAGCGSGGRDEPTPPPEHGTVLKATTTDVLTSNGQCAEMARKLRREMQRQYPQARGSEFQSGCSEIEVPLTTRAP
jgi:hypothetical protein